MKKEEAREKLRETKVYVDGKSEEIQNKLFEMDIFWQFAKDIQNVNEPFIYICDYITCGNDMTYFKIHDFREVIAEDILSIEIDDLFPKRSLMPFEKVLVRDDDDDDWKCDFFSHFDKANGIFAYTSVNGLYKQCIPYEGNEDLVGKVSPANTSKP